MSMVELLVLGLISEEPRHGYDIIREFRARGYAQWSHISEISVYKAIERLHAKGFIEPAASRMGSKTPDRRTFELTDLGKERLSDLVFSLLGSEVPLYHDYFLPLEFHKALPVEETITALEKRLFFLEARSESIADFADNIEGVLDMLQSLMAEHLEEIYRREVVWLRRVIDELKKQFKGVDH